MNHKRVSFYARIMPSGSYFGMEQSTISIISSITDLHTLNAGCFNSNFYHKNFEILKKSCFFLFFKLFEMFCLPFEVRTALGHTTQSASSVETKQFELGARNLLKICAT